MLSVWGVSCNDYSQRVGRGQPVPQVPCPDPTCEGRLQKGHGYYKRYLDGVPAEMRRVRCGRCGVSHAVLPEDACAYRDATLDEVELAVDAGIGPSARRQSPGELGTGAVRRVRRWVHGLGVTWAGRLLGLLPAGPGSWLERVRAAMGPKPGALVRLRHWLWATSKVFFSGPSGLFRHGRPREPPRGGDNRPW